MKKTWIAALLAGALGVGTTARADDDQPTRPDDVREQLEQAQKMVRELQARLEAFEKQRTELEARRAAAAAEAAKARDVAEAARLERQRAADTVRAATKALRDAETSDEVRETVRRALEKAKEAGAQGGEDPIVLRFSEEIDPKSISPDRVRVRRLTAGAGGKVVVLDDDDAVSRPLVARLSEALRRSLPGAEIEAKDGVIVVEADGNAQDVHRRVEEAIRKGVDVLIRRMKVVHEGDEATDHVTIDLVPQTKVFVGDLPVPPQAPRAPQPPMAPPAPQPPLAPLPPGRWEIERSRERDAGDADVRDAVKSLRDELRGLREELKSLREELRGGSGPR